MGRVLYTLNDEAPKPYDKEELGRASWKPLTEWTYIPDYKDTGWIIAGPGYRLLVSDEKFQEGDEFFSPSAGKWFRTSMEGCTVGEVLRQHGNQIHYRRKLENYYRLRDHDIIKSGDEYRASVIDAGWYLVHFSIGETLGDWNRRAVGGSQIEVRRKLD